NVRERNRTATLHVNDVGVSHNKMLKRNLSDELENVSIDHISFINYCAFTCADTVTISTTNKSMHWKDNEVNGIDQFGLKSFLLKLDRPQTINLLHTSYWFLLTNSAKFNFVYDECHKIIFDKGYSINLCYGALTTMNQFVCYASPYFFDSNEFCRVYNSESQPQSSTIRLAIGTTDNLDKNEKINEKAMTNVQRCFKNFIHFFQQQKISIYFGSINFNRNVDVSKINPAIIFPTFIKNYAWQMLLNCGCRIEEKITHSFIQEMMKLNSDELFYHVCERLVRQASRYYFLDLSNELRSTLDHYESFYLNSLFRQSAQSWQMIPYVIVTPTGIKVKPFQISKSNRVFRAKDKFGDIKNFALVEFRDDNGCQLQSRDYCSLKELFRNYISESGRFRIGNRLYRYYHHAQSQLRERQVYFYYENLLEDCLPMETGYLWLGDFSSIRVPAKYAARMSLCFSSTEATIRIHDAMGFRDVSSVIQIRYGGNKGTLVCDPRLDVEEKKVIFRHSMRKFNTDHDTLELCKRSIPRDVMFLSLQLKHTFWLTKPLLSTTSAIELIREKVLRVFELDKLSNHPSLYDEPFFRRLIIETRKSVMYSLKKRAHIRIDNTKGRYMFGVVDEHRILKPGQVFIQYSDMNNYRKTTILTNVTVAITKNPCQHPGDLRTFIAVDVPQLRHLKDCLVFPQQGQRPHSHEIAGSDLDGDEYTVIWEKELVPLTPNFLAYDYDSDIKQKELDRPIIRQDNENTVLEICQQDHLGRLSHSGQFWLGRRTFGFKCIQST
ncbi:unnamed protein product, partial [Didymodactylos carnosus]